MRHICDSHLNGFGFNNLNPFDIPFDFRVVRKLGLDTRWHSVPFYSYRTQSHFVTVIKFPDVVIRVHLVHDDRKRRLMAAVEPADFRPTVWPFVGLFKTVSLRNVFDCIQQANDDFGAYHWPSNTCRQWTACFVSKLKSTTEPARHDFVWSFAGRVSFCTYFIDGVNYLVELC